MKALGWLMGLMVAVVWTAAAQEHAKPVLKVTSPTITANLPIPVPHTCDALDMSPSLKWEGAPSGTKSFAVICDDPDAPAGVWTHWVVFAIPATATGLPENLAKTETVDTLNGVKQGQNSFGKVGYNGPCPPPGKLHHYRFKVYALDEELNLPANATSDQLETAMKKHVLGRGELVGTYQR